MHSEYERKYSGTYMLKKVSQHPSIYDKKWVNSVILKKKKFYADSICRLWIIEMQSDFYLLRTAIQNTKRSPREF